MTAQELKNLRIDLRLKQDEFAQRLNISRGYLNRLESGKTVISDNLLQRISSIFETPKESKHPTIPFFDIETSSTPLSLFEGTLETRHTNLDLPGFQGSSFAITISSHAMYPAIESGSMIICKEVTDKSIILYGEIFLIVTKDYRFVRRLKRSDKKGYVTCCADNHNGHDSKRGLTFQDVEVPVDKILYLYLVMGSIKRLAI